jgi:hypothetical protein
MSSARHGRRRFWFLRAYATATSLVVVLSAAAFRQTPAPAAQNLGEKPRLTLTVDTDGNPRTEAFDESGKLLERWPPKH